MDYDNTIEDYTLFDWLDDSIIEWDYFKGFGEYSEGNCILMQVFAEILFNSEVDNESQRSS